MSRNEEELKKKWLKKKNSFLHYKKKLKRKSYVALQQNTKRECSNLKNKTKNKS